jgi:wyosine [tRNA(Phe)-imidazoG37] synthetase (radical SAM superfamily)
MPKTTVYGPVASWRLGRSLGVDLLNSDTKICNYDCVYCQLGKTGAYQTGRQEFVSLDKLRQDLEAVKGVEADYVTFSGMGEPTLAANLGEAISTAREILGLPVAVITNASFIKDEQVRRELALADTVIAKLDAADDQMLAQMNHPAEGIKLAPILQGLQMFRLEYSGRLVIDIMLTDNNKSQLFNLNYYAKMMMPQQVQLNTPRRPSPCQALPDKELAEIRKTWFWNQQDVLAVCEASRSEVTPLDEEETELRHPTRKRPASGEAKEACAPETGNGNAQSEGAK